MASDKEYYTLLDKYNILISKTQDLQGQLLKKQQQWQVRDEEFENIEKVVRELCEDILAKDPKEMVLGEDYSWSSLSVLELINKSKNVLREYVANSKSQMRKLLDALEDRRQINESLQEQIEIMKTQPGAIQIDQQELEKQIQKEKKKEQVFASLPIEMKKRVESGKAEISLDEHDFIETEEEILYDDISQINAKAQITPKSIPTTPNREIFEKRKKRKGKMMAHTIDLKEYEAKLDNISWEIIRVMGAEGISIYMDIENRVILKNPTTTPSKCRSCIGLLVATGLAHKEPIQNPLKGRFYVYQLTDMGSRLYKERYNDTAVVSEMDRIIVEHDNCIHGYGIKFVADELRENGDFESVNDMNRKHPIDCGNGLHYIPDIICTSKNGHKMYIEYECANHTQTNFNAKCNKMTKITDVLNFIGPNQNDVNKIKEKVVKWIENRGAKSLTHVTIRVTGAYQLKNADLMNDRNWKLVFKPGKRLEPYENL